MAATDNRFAERCLPLLIANQAGWFILNSHRIRVVWDGGRSSTSLRIENLSASPLCPAVSHFGHGILTWTLPYLFRTPPGYNLLARGPANWPKPGAYALDGIVETDWSAATFTMNWIMTRPDEPIVFDVEEPICMIVPQRRGELESLRPVFSEIADYPEERRIYEQWAQDRAQFLSALRLPGSKAAQQGWQGDYFRGRLPDGAQARGHQSKINLRGFDGGDRPKPQDT
jgi:hypothetical protein